VMPARKIELRTARVDGVETPASPRTAKLPPHAFEHKSSEIT
jgi:hypothetical protein